MQALELADYRAAVARIYLTATSIEDFRAQRDKLFATHPQSAIPRGEPFDGLIRGPDPRAAHRAYEIVLASRNLADHRDQTPGGGEGAHLALRAAALGQAQGGHDGVLVQVERGAAGIENLHAHLP